MKLKLLPYVVLCLSILAHSQNLENSKWYFGQNSALNFDTVNNNPEPILPSQSFVLFESPASVADAQGNLLFYTDGSQLYNSNHQPMQNSNGLQFPLGAQATIIVPSPNANDNIYYIFTHTDPISYSVVDMDLDNGLGAVTQKNIDLVSLRRTYSEKLTSTLHADGDKIWVITQLIDSFYAFLVTESGIQQPVISPVPSNGVDIVDSHTAYGNLKISPDGAKLAISYNHQPPSTLGSLIHLYDFNNNTGQISNLQEITDDTGGFVLGLDFSPNSQFLYYADTDGDVSQTRAILKEKKVLDNKRTNDSLTEIYQVNLRPSSNNSRQLYSSTIIGSFISSLPTNVQLATNGKIYLNNFDYQNLSVIDNPDGAGSASNFILNGVTIPSPMNSIIGLPQIVHVVEAEESIEHFITTWRVDNITGTDITIPTFPGETYNYDVDWEGDGVFDDFSITGNITHDYGTAGTYEVHIRGDFPRIYFKNNFVGPNDRININPVTNRSKIFSIDNWGLQIWNSMNGAFYYCINLNEFANDTPNLSIVTDMSEMFHGASSLNQPIDDWDVSNVTDMSSMFNHAITFNQPLNNWDVSNVTNMSSIFYHANTFNQPLENWDVGNVTSMASMFLGSSFNQSIGIWNVSNVFYMNSMFVDTPFNQNINNWDVSNVTSMRSMFSSASNYNQPLNNWNVSNVSDMDLMFRNANSFNQPLNNWNVSNVTRMNQMFARATNFNNPLNNWNVFNVTQMSSMFEHATNFNQPLNNWNVSNVNYMTEMFYGSVAFNQPLNDWSLSSVISIRGMFKDATSFNQPLNNWDVSNIYYMTETFYGASAFNQPLGDWNISSIHHSNSVDQNGLKNFLTNTNLSVENYDHLLNNWSQLDLSLLSNIILDAGSTNYCDGSQARQDLINFSLWIINDGGIDPNCRVSTAEISDIMVFPNPTKSLINFEFTEKDITNFSLEIKNIYGLTIITSKNQKQLDVSRLNIGIYFITITTDSGQIITKQIVKK